LWIGGLPAALLPLDKVEGRFIPIGLHRTNLGFLVVSLGVLMLLK
jgi:hypothetical protein